MPKITLPDGIQSSKMSVSLWLYSDVNAPTDKIVLEFFFIIIPF